MRKRILLVITLLTIAVFISGCSKKEKTSKPPKTHRVEVVAAKQQGMEEILETTGDVIATNTVTLEATVEGPISYCPWREGDKISKNERVIEINRPLYRQEYKAAKAALAVAEAELADLKAGARPEEIAQAKESVRHFEDCTEFAKADYDRIRKLVQSGSLPAENAEKARVSYTKCKTQLDAAKQNLEMLKAGPTKTEIAVAQANVEQAKAKAALSQAKLDECILKAPFSGVATEVYVREGDLATPRAKLIKMMDPASLVVRAGLPETSAAHIRIGEMAKVRLDAYPEKKFSAEIIRVYPRIEQQSRTRLVEAKILEDVELMPRMFARLAVRGRVFEKTITVPDAAVVTTPRGYKVVFVVEEGVARARKVKIGLDNEKAVQITEGLDAGEVVVVDGNLNLTDGALVNTGKTNKQSNKSGGKQQ